MPGYPVHHSGDGARAGGSARRVEWEEGSCCPRGAAQTVGWIGEPYFPVPSQCRCTGAASQMPVLFPTGSSTETMPLVSLSFPCCCCSFDRLRLSAAPRTDAGSQSHFAGCSTAGAWRRAPAAARRGKVSEMEFLTNSLGDIHMPQPSSFCLWKHLHRGSGK